MSCGYLNWPDKRASRLRRAAVRGPKPDRTQRENGRGKVYQYSYSPRGEVVDMTYPSLNNEEWSYGANGDVTARYLGIPGHIIGYAYDDAGRLTGIDYPTGTDTAFAYDAADRLVEMIDASGTTEWEYNDADELIQLTTPQGVVNYVYKLDGQLEKIQQPSMNDLVYRYDDYGRVDRITSAFNEVTDVLYDNLGARVERKNLPNGTYETYEYDARGRVTEILLSDSGDDLLRKLAYTYNEVDNIEQIVETREGPTTITKTYAYDAIDQLIEETWSTGYSAEYEYDENGNRTRRTVGTTVEDYFYGDDDELTEIKIGSTVVKSFGYDGAGRRTSATYSGVTTNYAYDYESRITSITRTGVTANSFAYNGLDTRVSKTDSTGTTSYKRAGAYVTDSLLKSTVSSTTTDHTPGVSSRTGSDSAFLHSGIENADTQTDDGGDVSAMRRYDAFGNPVAAWGGWQGPFGYGGPYGYQSDPDHGLMLLGHRYYESDTGRFLTRDPIKDGRNWYGYCGGNPLSKADSRGTMFIMVIGGMLGHEALVEGEIIETGNLDLLPIRLKKPPGYSTFDNIAVVDRMRRDLTKRVAAWPYNNLPGGTIVSGANYYKEKLRWFRDMVTDGGLWDYKRLDPALEDFGNWHYGFIGSEVGIHPQILLRAAGYNQMGKEKLYDVRNGQWTDTWPSTYGDFPRDQDWIKRGISDWQRFR